MRPGLVILMAATLIASAQEPQAIPVDQEPHHKVVYRNDFVRVIDATFPAGYMTLNHTHDVDNVAVTISTGRGGSPGRAGFSKGGYSHRVTNSGPDVMRFIDAEILKTDRPGSAATLHPGHSLETENDRVRIYRVKLGQGQPIEPHAHAAGWLEVTVVGGSGPGTFLWHSAGEAVPLAVTPGTDSLEIVEIEPR